MYKQGDIVVVKFPFTDGLVFKRRPALIISNQKVNKSGDYLIVQITSKIHNDGLSLAIGNQDCLKELPLKSFIRSHKLFTLHENLILSSLTKTKPDFLEKVKQKVVGNLK